LPWEETDQYIRSGHRNPDEFEEGTFRTIVISRERGIKAVVAKPRGGGGMRVVSYLFDKSKGWTLDEAKKWFEEHGGDGDRKLKMPGLWVVERINPEKPLRVWGVAIKAGVSRNRNVYLEDELRKAAETLKGKPVYLEHVSAGNAVGRVVNAWWDPDEAAVFFEAEIYDEDVADRIRAGLIQRVSIGADYEVLDDARIPRGLSFRELSLVAAPGVPETRLEVLERLKGGVPHKLREVGEEVGELGGVSLLPRVGEDRYGRVASLLREAVTSTAATAAIPQVWAPEIARSPAGVVANLRDVVKVYPQIKAKPGDKVKIPRIATPEFVEFSEGSAPSEASYTIDALEVTLGEYGNTVSVSYTVLEDISADVVATMEDGFVEAAKLKEDEIILTQLDAIDAGDLAAVLYGGDATSEDGVDSGDVMDPDLIGKAVKEVMEEGFPVKAGDMAVVLHPKQYQDLVLNTQFTNVAAWGARDVVSTGRLTSYMGVDILVSGKVPTGTGSGGITTYHAYAFRKDAVALVPKRDLLIETEKDTAARLLKLTASHRFGVGILFPKAVVRIITA